MGGTLWRAGESGIFLRPHFFPPLNSNTISSTWPTVDSISAVVDACRARPRPIGPWTDFLSVKEGVGSGGEASSHSSSFDVKIDPEHEAKKPKP